MCSDSPMLIPCDLASFPGSPFFRAIVPLELLHSRRESLGLKLV